MKLAVYQAPTTRGDIAGAMAGVTAMMAAAAQAGAKMLVAPELVLPGYNCPDLHAELAQPVDGAWLRDLQAQAARIGCGVTLGFAERSGEAVYNSAVCIGADGTLRGHHRKLQLFGAMEAASFTPGNSGYAVFDLEGRRAGLLICYDVEFPGHVAALRDLGAELILVPTANPAGYEQVPRILLPARAHEARATIAYANFCGSEAGLDFGGLSVIVGPDAQPLAQAGTGPALLVVDLAPVAAIAPEHLSSHAQEYRAVDPDAPAAPGAAKA